MWNLDSKTWLYLDPSCPINWAEPLNAGLVSQWMCLPQGQWGGGKTWRDLNRASVNDGTCTNMAFPSTATSGWGPTTRQGGFGEMRFDGSDDRVAMGSNVGISGNAAFSMSGWVYPSAITEPHTLVAFGDGSNSLAAAALMIGVAAGGAGTFSNGNGNLSLECGGGNGSRTATGVVAINTWQHIAVSKSSGTLAAATVLYVNGQSIALSTSSANTPNITNGAANIGAFAPGFVNYFLAGRADAIRIYNRALSASEVATVYREDMAGCPRLLNRIRRYVRVSPATGGGRILRSSILRSRIIQGVSS